MNLGLDPVNCEGYQTHTIFRIETLDRLHQAYVAFLDQIRLGQPITRVAAGNVDHEAQMRKNQLTRGFHITIVMQPLGELALFLDRQYRNAAGRLDIGLKVGTRNQSVDDL